MKEGFAAGQDVDGGHEGLIPAPPDEAKAGMTSSPLAAQGLQKRCPSS
ncbi:MAG: hypothetical protein IAE79_26790 [Anaerolinea sp.]|nr:hypothetical protein [Anaerolinea sp.]